MDEKPKADLLEEIEFQRREDGKIVVSKWPKPRWSSDTFLSDLVAEFGEKDATNG